MIYNLNKALMNNVRPAIESLSTLRLLCWRNKQAMELNAPHLHLTSAVENQSKKTLFIMFYIESFINFISCNLFRHYKHLTLGRKSNLSSQYLNARAAQSRSHQKALSLIFILIPSQGPRTRIVFKRVSFS